MNYNIITIIGIFIPFVGTMLGSAIVFFCKEKINEKFNKIFLGFASGVMIAASVWSLIIPSIEMAEEQGKVSWLPATIGVIFGALFIYVIDKIIVNVSKEKNKTLSLAITLHNIPEGMAIGVAFASAINIGTYASFISAFTIALGIAVQNIPEGMSISLPLKSNGFSKIKSFYYGALSGIVEPIASVITIAISGLIVKILPVLLTFAAGSMIYVVVKELIPESQNGKYSDFGLIGVILGFLIMMILDVSLG